MDVSTEENQPQLLVTSRVKANLSLSVCSKTGASGCEDTQIILVDVVSSTQSVVVANLSLMNPTATTSPTNILHIVCQGTSSVPHYCM